MADPTDGFEVQGPCSHEPVLPPARIMKKIFDSFFTHVYPIPVFSFLHRASLLQSYQSGRANQGLLFAIIALTILVADVDPETNVSASQYIDAAQGPVLQQLERPSIAKLQTLVLIIRFKTLTRQSAAAFMLLPTATRIAYILRLNYENPERDVVARESCRRLMWSVFMLDGMMSGGLPDFRLCASETMHIQLPCNEENFELGVDESTQDLETPQSGHFPASTGLVALYIRIQGIRSRILQYTKRIVASRSHGPEEIQRGVSSLNCDLEVFGKSLPSKYTFSQHNIRLRAFSPRLSAFILVHIWWHQCHCDLFRIALSGLREGLPRSATEKMTPDFVSHCRKQCFDHAASVIKVFTTLQSLEIESPFLDWDTVACAYQSARYLLYGYQLDGEGCGMTAEKVKLYSAVCLAVVQGRYLPQKAALEKSHTDIETMVERDLLKSPALKDPLRPQEQRDSSTSLSPASQQILSWQSLIFSVKIEADSDEVSMPPTSLRHTPDLAAIALSYTDIHSEASTDTASQTVDFSLTSDPFSVLFNENLHLDFYGFNNMAWLPEQSSIPGSDGPLYGTTLY